MLQAFHRQELPPARALLVEDHLRECVSCRSYANGREAGATSVNWRIEPGARGFYVELCQIVFRGGSGWC